MGLILPGGPNWAYCTNNLVSMDADALGATCTSGTSNSDGSTVPLLLAALNHDVEFIRLAISASVPSSGNNDILMDLMIDPAGGTSWTSLIDDLIVGALGNTGTSGSEPASPSGIYDFPLWIPAGASLGIRARSAHSVAATLKVACFAFGGNANPASWWCGQRVSSVAINASASTGQSHAAGNGNKSISNCADNGSGAIRVTTSGGHSLSTGDEVVVYGVAGTVEANGRWIVTVVDSTNFDLDGSAFVNSYTSGGSASVFSTWANLGSTLGAACGALQWAVNGSGSGFYSSASYQFEFGVGGRRIGPPVFRNLTSSEAGWWLSTGPIFKRLAAGAQLQVRATCSVFAQSLGVAAYAVH